jgi:Domain of unknown function (DUF1707)
MLGGMGREDMRAGDGDRKAVADQLKSALDEGRLDLSEYDERLQKTYGAKTFGDLQGLLTDLPNTVPPAHSQVQSYQAQSAPTAPPPDRAGGRQVAAWVGPYAGVIVICTIIWAITSASAGHLTYYWPVWMLIPLVFGVMGQAFGGNRSQSDGARAARRAARRQRRGR